MKKLLATLLILCAGPVWAEWVMVMEWQDGGSHFYDPSTIRGQNIKRVWTRVEISTKNNSGWRSTRVLVEIDCPDERYKNLQFTAYDEPGLKGRLVDQRTFSSPEWVYVEPETAFSAIFKIVCRKK